MEVAIGIAGIAACVGTFFLGRWYERREREADKREQRIARFVDDYVDRSRRHINTGITALVPSGIFQLRDDGEIREALHVCKKQLGKHPLGREEDTLNDADLKAFFEFVASEGGNFAKESVAQTLERFRTKR